MNEVFLAGLPTSRTLQFALVIAVTIAYVWRMQSWLSDDAPESDEENSSLLRLSRKGEYVRWRLADAAIFVVLLEIAYNAAHSWGIYFALLIAVVAYLASPHLITGGTQIDLTPRQNATRRRWAILPVAFLLFKGTDFQVEPLDAVTMVAAGLLFALLILVPEPRE